jgi:hypothetical protein
VVRTLASHAGNTGSNPVRATDFIGFTGCHWSVIVAVVTIWFRYCPISLVTRFMKSNGLLILRAHLPILDSLFPPSAVFLRRNVEIKVIYCVL